MCVGFNRLQQEQSSNSFRDESNNSIRDGEKDECEKESDVRSEFYCPHCAAKIIYFTDEFIISIKCWRCNSRTNGWLAVTEPMIVELMALHGFENEDQAFDFVMEKTKHPIIH